MPSLTQRIQSFLKSPQGRKTMDEGKRLARDPNTRRKVDDLRRRFLSRGKAR
jgi:hypothetical protein